MSSDVSAILDQLRQDHHNMSLLLDLIEQEANRIYAARSADYDRLLEIMRYMTGYPDAVHHPREDRLYDEVRRVRPDLATGFERIAIDHRVIGSLGRRLRDDLAGFLSGVPANRKLLADDAMHYVNAQRSHMQWEDIDLFRRCTELAAQGHRFPLDFEAGEGADPLFGDSREKEYQRVLSRIRSTHRGRAHAWR
jgi:hemerythrin-like domain-containing protein